MDGSQGSSGAPAPFLLKTYELVDDSSTDTIVSWSQNGCSFVVWNQTEFAKELLPMYFKHNNFSSFVRQLNTYGFRKIDPDQWEFANEEFLRGGRHLLKNIHRRKPIHSHSGPAQGHPAAPLTDPEKQEYENEIARLRHEKNALQSELQRHENDRKEFDLKARSLHDRFQHIELRQAQLMSSLAELVRNPGIVSALVQRSELHSKKRRVSGSESNSEETRDFLRLDRIERFESCLEFLDSFLAEAGQEFIVSMFSQGETEELDMRSSSPISHLSSPNSFDVRSPRDLSCASLFPAFLGSDDAGAKSPGIDVNSSPAKGHGVVEIEIVPDVSVNNNVNDLFWEQCLTETPGSSETNGEESEKNEAQRRDWWGLNNNVDNLTAQIGHLTPAM